jgi:putative hydrolase of the HAD superfamily
MTKLFTFQPIGCPPPISEKRFCVVLDLDDTLFLERDYVQSGFAAVDEWVARKYSVTGFGAHCWHLFEEGARERIFDQAAYALGISPEAHFISDIVETYRNHAPRITLPVDSRECLISLKDRYNLALISDGRLAAQEAKLEALQVRNMLGPVYFTDRWGRAFWKPHPRAFQAVQIHFGLASWKCVYVADNPVKDFHAPVKLGWHTIRVRRPGSLHQAVECQSPVAPELEIPDLSHLEKGLKALGL